MAVDKAAYRLDSEVAERGDDVLEGQLQHLYSDAAAMYEALWDAIAPGDSSQAWSGHDHAKGGGPICRGVSWSEDGGEDYIYRYTPTSARQKALLDSDGTSKQAGTARYFGSPLYVYGVAMLAGMICYTATGSKFRLTFAETKGSVISARTQEVELTLDETGETPLWVEMPPIPLNPGVWNQLEIYVENESHGGTSDPVLNIFGIVIVEAPGITRYRPGLILSPLDGGLLATPSTSGIVQVGFPVLEQWLVQDRHWVDPDVLGRISKNCNGLFEGTLDRAAPGAVSQTCRGHDHEDYGGLGITRNVVARFGMGMRQPWQVDVTTGESGSTTPSTVSSSWIPADRDSSAGGLRSTASVAHMVGPVSPGITNTGTSSAPFLDAMVYVSASSISQTNYTVRVAIYSRDQTAFSAVGTIVATGSSLSGYVYIDKIPCVGDQFNEFDIYIECTAQPVTVVVHSCVISESTDVNGSRVARLENASTTTQLGVAISGTTPRS